MTIDESWRAICARAPSRHLTGALAETAFGCRRHLAETAERWSRSQRSVRYLEVGVRRGHSFALVTLAAGERLEYGIGVDAWIENYGDEPNEGKKPVYDLLASVGIQRDRVWLMSGNSHELLPMLIDVCARQFNLILVDGDHTPGGAALDLKDCWNLLEPGGLLVFDDLVGELSEVWGSFVSRRVRRGEVASMSWWPSPGPPPWGWARKRP